LSLPGGYSSRPATLEDIPEVVALRSAHDLAIGDPPEPHREFYSWFWRRPLIDLGRDSLLVHDADGVLRGLAHVVWDPASGGTSQALGRVHPDRFGTGIGTALLSWTQEVAASRQSSPKRMHSTASVRDDAATTLLRSHGFQRVRSSWDMELVLSGDERRPSPPAGITLRSFATGRDERALYAANQDTFVDHFDHRSQTFELFASDWWGSEEFDPTLVWFAEERDDVAGYVAALAFEAEGYIASVGVRKRWRGRGIATCLLRQAFAELAERGLRLVSLSVDSENETGAVELYRKLGMSVRLETLVWEKELE
jgi:mycothiol synthase